MRALVLGLLFLASCFDPVHDDAVSSLGPERSGERPGPTHRSGQPCLTCHGGQGPGSPQFSIAGTVFTVRGGTEPASGATVTITDANNETHSFTTNRAGNFYVGEGAWSPTFPLSVAVDGQGVHAAMVSKVGRDGSCGSCHRDAGDANHMPGVYVSAK